MNGHADPGERRPLRFWFTVWGLLLLLALASAARLYFSYGTFGRGISWWDALGTAFADWTLWGLTFPLILWSSRRFPFVRGRLLRACTAHVLGGVVVSTVQLALFAGWSAWIRELRFDSGSFRSEVGSGFFFRFHAGVFVYWAAILGLSLLRSEERRRAAQLQHVRLDRELDQARLRVLQTQLRPHFLFNTLNTILAQVRSAPEQAERMLVGLGDLLRQTLAHGEESELSVKQELELLGNYIAIEELRFGERLQVSVQAAAETHACLVPAFLLQPLVENAIQHGVARRTGGRVEVRLIRAGDRLRILVRDDGPGFESPSPDGATGMRAGVGLENTRERLRLLHPEDHTFDISAVEPHGTEIRIELPARRAEASP